jgi:hypothetical protein
MASVKNNLNVIEINSNLREKNKPGPAKTRAVVLNTEKQITGKENQF